MSKIIARLGLGSCGVAAGAGEVWTALQQVVQEKNLPVQLEKTACIGMCFEEPLLELSGAGKANIMLGKVTPADVPSVLEGYLNDNLQYKNIVLNDRQPAVHNELIANQKRIVLRNCGKIDPEKIEDYETAG